MVSASSPSADLGPLTRVESPVGTHPVSEASAHGNLPTYQELLDMALEMTFPASDPIAVSGAMYASQPVVTAQQLLDESLEMTFPASDPVAPPSHPHTNEESDWVLDGQGEPGKPTSH